MRRHSLVALLAGLLIVLVHAVLASPPRQLDRLQVFLLDERTDLELLANAALGEGVRPPTWTFNVKPDSTTFIADLWFDNEQLADTVFGQGKRPVRPEFADDWIGATSTDAAIVARNIRHDLELAADEFYTKRGETRPSAWRGAPRIFSCARTLQNLVQLIRSIYSIQTSTPEATFDYCSTVAAEVDDKLIDIISKSTDLETKLPDLILAVRGDLERLADELKGLNIRPPSWIKNIDRDSPTIISDNFLDLNNLADDQLGRGQRPKGWIGVVSNSAAVSFRSLRHDLELLADAKLGEGVRPHGWQGEDPLQRCDTTIQNLVFVVSTNYGFTISDDMKASPDFCKLVEFSANNLAETPPPPEEIQEVLSDRYNAFSGTDRSERGGPAFAYLDKAATEYMGIMPNGTEFRALYRNYSPSTMMYVMSPKGDFGVFIDRRWTTLSQEVFNTLPTMDGVKPLGFCEALWCNGPAPTPTPTGSGPLELIVLGSTPPAAVNPAQLNKTLVTWNNVRVGYVLDDPVTRTFRVTLEVCAEAEQITCEPVSQVFDQAVGLAKPVVTQVNGLNVYEFAFPYGYKNNLVIEGNTLYSTDVWFSEPPRP